MYTVRSSTTDVTFDVPNMTQAVTLLGPDMFDLIQFPNGAVVGLNGVGKYSNPVEYRAMKKRGKVDIKDDKLKIFVALVNCLATDGEMLQYGLCSYISGFNNVEEGYPILCQKFSTSPTFYKHMLALCGYRGGYVCASGEFSGTIRKTLCINLIKSLLSCDFELAT